MFEFFRNLIASAQPQIENFNIVDPKAIGDDVRMVTLAFTSGGELSSSTDISLYWEKSKNKLFEKRFKNDHEARETYDALKSDLAEVAQLTKEAKKEEAKHLVTSLLEKYAVFSDTIIDVDVAPKTTTNASKKKADDNKVQEIIKKILSGDDPYYGKAHFHSSNMADYDIMSDTINEMTQVYHINEEEAADIIKSLTHSEDFRSVSKKKAESKIKCLECGMSVPDVPEDAKYDEKLCNKCYEKSEKESSKKEAGVKIKNTFQTIEFDTNEEAMKWQEQTKKLQPDSKPSIMDDETPGMDKEVPGLDKVDEEGQEIGPPSVSYEDAEENEANERKSLAKQIETTVKEEVDNALSAKIAAQFGDKEVQLVEAMRNMGRTDPEIIEYMSKTLKYQKESVVAFLAELSEDNPIDPTLDPNKAPQKLDDMPLAPKPPETLVSPETHDKLVQEIENPEIEKKEPELEIAKKDYEIAKKAENPLETKPRPTNSTEEAFPQTDFDEADTSKDMIDDDVAITPDTSVELMLKGDTVYVQADYDSGVQGYEAIYIRDYKEGGDDYVTVETENGDLKDIRKNLVTKASVRARNIKIAKRQIQKQAEILFDELDNDAQNKIFSNVASYLKTMSMGHIQTFINNHPGTYSLKRMIETPDLAILEDKDDKGMRMFDPHRAAQRFKSHKEIYEITSELEDLKKIADVLNDIDAVNTITFESLRDQLIQNGHKDWEANAWSKSYIENPASVTDARLGVQNWQIQVGEALKSLDSTYDPYKAEKRSKKVAKKECKDKSGTEHVGPMVKYHGKGSNKAEYYCDKHVPEYKKKAKVKKKAAEFDTHGNDRGLNDLYILPSSDEEVDKITTFLKEQKQSFTWERANVEGHEWYGKNYLQIPFGESLQEEISSFTDPKNLKTQITDKTVEDTLEEHPTLDVNKKRDELLDQLNQETDPSKKEQIKKQIDNLKYASKKKALQRERGSLYNYETAQAVIDRLNQEIEAPLVRAYSSTLGGKENISILMTVSLDPKESWANQILENSRYGKYHISNDGTVEYISGPLKIRQKTVKDVDSLIVYLNQFFQKSNITQEETQSPQSPQSPQASKKKAGPVYCAKPGCSNKGQYLKSTDGRPYCSKHMPEPDHDKKTSKKEAAPQPQSKPQTQLQTPPQPKSQTQPQVPQEENIRYERMKNAPSGKREEEVDIATDEMREAYSQFQVVQKNIKAIELSVKEILHKAKADAQKVEHELGKSEEVSKHQQLVNSIGKMVEAIDSQNVRIGNDILSYIEQEKTTPVKWNATQIQEWLNTKFPEVHAKLKQALNGAQRLAKTETTKHLKEYPVVPGDRNPLALSQFDNEITVEADMMGVLMEVYNDLKDAFEEMVQAPIEATASKKSKVTKKAAKWNAGDKVTTKVSTEGYYSNYGGNPEIMFNPGDVGTIVNPKVPKVRNSGGSNYFVLVEFEQHGKEQRVGLAVDELVRTEDRKPEKGPMDLAKDDADDARLNREELDQYTDSKWVYGTETNKWYLVGPDDRDYDTAISPEDFKKLGPEKAKELYLRPRLL